MKTLGNDAIDILEDGRLQRVTYQDLLSFHQGNAVWGASVGFRAMQAAGLALSNEKLWERNYLSIVSAHPGPGVRDAIEFVTRCFSRNRYQLLDPKEPLRCNENMQFRWWITQHDRTVEVELREGFVPIQFFELVGRVGSEHEKPEDSASLETMKADLTKRLWDEPLHTLFTMTNSTNPIAQDTLRCTNSASLETLYQ